MMRGATKAFVAMLAGTTTLTAVPPATAQETNEAVAAGEIIVTARKRQESILKVPVVVTALSGDQITAAQITSVTDLPRLVPGLVIAGNLLSIGPQVTIRGVGTSSFDPGVDQSVSLNIDGLSLGQGLAFGSAMFDVGQVEVLKGPQALFYGKSSPGGVISLRTADPTDKFEVIASAGYEFEAREGRGELIVSGPLSAGLKGRLATMYSAGAGYFINNAVPQPGTGALPPAHERNPQPRNFVIRGTLLADLADNLTARLKVTHAYDRSENAELKQLSNCPEGAAGVTFGSGFPGTGIPPAPNFLTPVDPINFIGSDNCRFDRYAAQVYLDPAAFPGVPNGGVPYLQNEQNFGTLELNFEPTPELGLTSTTAYYKLNSSSSVNPTLTAGSAPLFAVTNVFSRRQFTQELRLESDFQGPFNFTLGGFYEDGELRDRVRFIRNVLFGAISPPIVGQPFLPYLDILNDDRESTIDITTYSLFGQLRYKIVPQLELAGGLRWSDETRTLGVFDFHANTTNTPGVPDEAQVALMPGSDRVHSSTISPEVTLTWTPTDDLTLFGSWKKGFKSGSFSVAVPGTTGQDKSFGDEKVNGYEIGLKSRLLDRSLLANLAWYDYRYNGLQVGVIEGFVNGSPVINTRNSGAARTYGVDLDLQYRPPWAEGLTLNASVNWNRANYKELALGCYANQTVAQGCNLTPVAVTPTPTNPATVRYLAQNLNGAQMIRAPEWSGNFGFTYEYPVSSGWKLQVSNNNQFSSKYPSYLANGRPVRADTGLPDNFQPGFFKFDLGLALKSQDGRWEFAVIGKNLGDTLVASNCSASNTQGGGVFGGETAGFPTQQGQVGWAEALCFPDGPGRSVWLRLTLRPLQ
jgi:iron complex outermembrane recepter protein